MAPPVSSRAQRVLDSPPVADYIMRHHELVEDSWDPVTNPDGYIGMCIAENKLVWDLLEPRIADCRDLEHPSIGYDAMIGSLRFRRELADFMARTFLGRKVDAENVAVVNGAGSALELLFYILCDPGDGVLVPTPSYTGFWADIETRAELQIVPVHTSSDTGFELTTDRLDEALGRADRPIKALLYTNPNNPLGRVYPPDQVEEILGWAETNSLHVVLDEIYALSVFGDTPFVSGAQLRPDLGDWLHIVWAFSKDFGMSGLRSGVLLSENEAVLGAVQGLAYWAAVSGDTQSMLAQLIEDEQWVDGFLEENRRRLGDAYTQVTAVLDEYGIRYLPADSGFFFLVDVRPMLDEVTWEAEHELWETLLQELNVNITPGSACHNGEPGFMRLVFSATPVDALVEGAHRLGRFALARADR